MGCKRFTLSLTVLLILSLVSTVGATNNCFDCHSNRTALMKSAGGAIKTMVKDGKDLKDWWGNEITAEGLVDQMLVSPQFLQDVHGKFDCIVCHKGDPGAGTAEKAHGGDFIAAPTADGGVVCASCHKEIVTNFQSSLHFNVTGVLNANIGYFPKGHEGVVIAENLMQTTCLACHATCGTCHVDKPIQSGGGGLQNGHLFAKKPDDKLVCAGCHYRMGPMYLNKDVHAKKGIGCQDCHTNQVEMHGNGIPMDDMEADADSAASCEGCHLTAATTNEAHEIHNDFVSCRACHATEYMSCYGCHSGKEEKVKWEMKLGVGEDGKLTTFIHVPTVPDSYKHLGITLTDEYLAKKVSWLPYAAHTIQKAPILKKGAKSMCENCHGNEDIFITEKNTKKNPLDAKLIPKVLPGKLD